MIPRTHWIWTSKYRESLDNEPYIVLFRKTVSFHEQPDQYVIHISADTRYKLYVNGVLVETGPSRGDHSVWFYDEMNLAPYFLKGKNAVTVEVLRYAVAENAGNLGMIRTVTPGLFIEKIPDDNHRTSDEEDISADDTWKCLRPAGYHIEREAEFFAPLMIFERAEGDSRLKDWKMSRYNDSFWENAMPYNALQIPSVLRPDMMSPRSIPFMRRVWKELQRVVPQKAESASEENTKMWNDMIHGKCRAVVPANSHMSVELDAGELECGYLSLKLEQGRGSAVKILTSEGYVQHGTSKNGLVPRKGDRCDWEHGYLHGYTDQYLVAGYGNQMSPEVYEPYWFRTFRFIRLEITTDSESCIVAGLDYLSTGYPLDVRTKVSTSDSSLEPVWDISLRTLKRCMHETYIDCPFYEQLQYVMDSRSEILYTYAISADDRLARQCMNAFQRSQRDDGMVNCCYPRCGVHVIPGFSIYYILMIYDHMMYFGDAKLVRELMPSADRILNFFHEHLDERGLVGKVGGLNIQEKYWSFIDWTPEWDETIGMPRAGLKGPITMESLLYLMGLMHAAKLCDFIGWTALAKEYRGRAASIREAVNRYCRNQDGIYQDGPGIDEYSQHCQVFAVLTDTVDVTKGRALLLETLNQKEKYAQCSVAMAFYLFRALEKADLYDKTKDLWNLWRRMVKNHLTTCVENNVDERSDCHAWGSLALYEIPSVILGVRPAAPGYKKIRIAPVPGYFSWAEGNVVTKYGNVHVKWSRNDDGSIHLEYKVPEGTEVEEQ